MSNNYISLIENNIIYLDFHLSDRTTMKKYSTHVNFTWTLFTIYNLTSDILYSRTSLSNENIRSNVLSVKHDMRTLVIFFTI